jgi:hypothetical protein
VCPLAGSRAGPSVRSGESAVSPPRAAGRVSVDEKQGHGPGTMRSAMADEQQQSLQEQLEEIGAQLDWVRGYL